MDEKEDILLCFTFTTTVKEIIFVNAAIVYSYNIGRIVKQVMIVLFFQYYSSLSSKDSSRTALVLFASFNVVVLFKSII